MKRIYLIAVSVAILVIIIAVSIIFITKSPLSIVSPFKKSSVVLTTEVKNVGVSISTASDGIELGHQNLTPETIASYVDKMGIFPLADQPYIGTIDGENQSLNALRITKVSPKTIAFILLDLSEYEKGVSPQSLYSFSNSDGSGLITITSASFNKQTEKLTVPVYVNYKELKRQYTDDAKLNIRLTKVLMFELFLNFQAPPLTKNGDPYDHFLQKIDTLGESIFKQKESVSFFEKIGLIKVANAQCSGADSCGTLKRPPGVCNIGGNSCLDDTDCATGTCNRGPSYCDWSSPAILSCMGNPPYGIGCTTPCAICPSNACTNSATPPPSGPVCGNKICEAPSGETNASCPSDCSSTGGSTGGGNTCSGACFGGLNNCGEVGRQPASGSCGSGEMCCGFGSGGGGPTCRIWDHTPITVSVGETKYLDVNGFLYGDIILGSNAVLSNSNIANVAPLNVNLCCSTSWGDYTLRFSVTGLAPGSTWLTDRWGTSANNDTGSCTNSVLINVLPSTSTPSVNITANGTNGSVSVVSGSNVTIGWTSQNVDFCTASVGWSGSKSINGSELQNNITSNKVYVLTCTGSGGTVSDTVNVNIQGLPALPNIDLTVNGSPSQVVYVPTIPNPSWPWPINVNFKWVTTGATSCFGVSRPPNYVYPQPIVLGPMPGWFLWDWTHPVNGTGGNTTMGPVFYDLNCSGPGGASVATVEVIPGSAPPVITQCTVPTPNDPPTSVCAPNPTSNGSITWRWAPVVGANQYTFEVQSVPSLVQVAGTNTGIKPAAFFNCTAIECSYTTSLPTGRYRSSIIASSSTSACTPSTAGNSAPFDLGLCPVNPWWQGGTGNVISKGLITSQVPYNTMSFLTDGTSSVPGIAAGTSINTGSGTISSTGWSTDSVYSGTVPTYDDFYGQVPAGTTFIDPGANIAANTLTSGGTPDSAGFIWYRHTGDVTISANVVIPAGRKEVLFVDGGDVTINGTIQFANRANSFFMVVVNPTAGGTKGNIVVAPTVTAAAGTPAIEGMFCAKHLSTGVAATPLVIRGSVVVTNGVTLERDLGAGNNLGPAESFVQSPELIFNYPPALTFKRLSWQEVAP